MSHSDFVYWLQGHFELNPSNSLTETQVQIIRDHLALVFNKVTPNRTTDWNPNSSVIMPIDPMKTMAFCASNIDEDGYYKFAMNSTCPASC